MKRLLGSAALAVGLLAGSAAQARADCGFGVGVGVSFSCGSGKGQCGQCQQAGQGCMMPPGPQMCCPPMCGAPVPGFGCYGGPGGWDGHYTGGDAARGAEAAAAAAMRGAQSAIGF